MSTTRCFISLDSCSYVHYSIVTEDYVYLFLDLEYRLGAFYNILTRNSPCIIPHFGTMHH